MPPRLILAGVPKGHYRRFAADGYVLHVPGWDVVTVKSTDDRPNLSSCWYEVLDSAADLSDSNEGAHIMAFHHADSERQRFDAEISERYRLIWLNRTVLRLYGSPEFSAKLATLASIEETWRCDLRPRTCSDALILPSKVFKARGRLDALWVRVQQAKTADEIEAVEDLQARFSSHDIGKGVWRDARGWEFDSRGSRHADHLPNHRHWKFTFRLDKGFHFDLSNDSQRVIRDCEGTPHRLKGRHLNMDSHGYVRGS